MFHNSVIYGVISTVNSFAFLRREREGKLCLTRLMSATRTDPTILSLLYYFSNLCATAARLVEKHPDGRPITVIRAPGDSSIAPLVPRTSLPRDNTSSRTLSNIQLETPRRSPRFNHTVSHSKSALMDEDNLYLDIDVTAQGTCLGYKGYKGIVYTARNISGELVFVKLWDGWKYSSEEADRESAVYTSLHELWGTRVPRLIAHGGWGFCHVLVLEFIEVIPVIFALDH